jgi:hypothetical protein
VAEATGLVAGGAAVGALAAVAQGAATSETTARCAQWRSLHAAGAHCATDPGSC